MEGSAGKDEVYGFLFTGILESFMVYAAARRMNLASDSV